VDISQEKLAAVEDTKESNFFQRGGSTGKNLSAERHVRASRTGTCGLIRADVAKDVVTHCQVATTASSASEPKCDDGPGKFPLGGEQQRRWERSGLFPPTESRVDREQKHPAKTEW